MSLFEIICWQDYYYYYTCHWNTKLNWPLQTHLQENNWKCSVKVSVALTQQQVSLQWGDKSQKKRKKKLFFPFSRSSDLTCILYRVQMKHEVMLPFFSHPKPSPRLRGTVVGGLLRTARRWKGLLRKSHILFPTSSEQTCFRNGCLLLNVSCDNPVQVGRSCWATWEEVWGTGGLFSCSRWESQTVCWVLVGSIWRGLWSSAGQCRDLAGHKGQAWLVSISMAFSGRRELSLISLTRVPGSWCGAAGQSRSVPMHLRACTRRLVTAARDKNHS